VRWSSCFSDGRRDSAAVLALLDDIDRPTAAALRIHLSYHLEMTTPVDLDDRPAPGTSVVDLVRNLRGRSIVAAVVVAVLLTFAAFAIAERVWLGTWPLAKYPDALHYCGFSYRRQGEQATPLHLYPAFVFKAPLVSSRQVFADTPKGSHVGDTPQCSAFLYLKSGASKVLVYAHHFP
jgi:hypothetical protein